MKALSFIKRVCFGERRSCRHIYMTSIKAYNAKSKFYKNIKQDIVYVGIPISYMDTIAELCRAKGYNIEQRGNSVHIASDTDKMGMKIGNLV